MKKILASILAAFFVVLFPISAYAATTESMMMFSTGFVSDEYAVMPLSSPTSYPVSTFSGFFNRITEDFSFAEKSYGLKSNGEVLSSTDFSGVGSSFNYQNFILPAYGLSIGSPNESSGFSVPDGSNLSISLNDIYFSIYSSTDNYTKQFVLNPSVFVPVKVYADLYYTATQQIGNTHSGTYTTDTIDLSNFLQPSSNPFFPSAFDLNANISISAPGLPADSNIDRLYNVRLRYIKIYFVADVSSYVLDGGDVKLINFATYGDTFTNYFTVRNSSINAAQSSYIYVNYNSNGGDASSGVVSSVQSSISSLGTNVSTQISQVKTQITQSTNTITTKIDTMSQEIQTGLSNVVESAKQNTQNIINTVTQKVDQVNETVTEVKDSILDLPNKIQEMLLGLIVPDSDTMADKYSEFSGLLEEKLGVIYQIPMMLFDFFDTIVNAATTPQSTLTLPAFRLPWIDGSQLTIWNSMEYKIIPDGLEVLSDLIRTVTSMTVVVLTFNSVKQAYERFLRS